MSVSLTDCYEDCECLSGWNKLQVRWEERTQKGADRSFKRGELLPLCPEQLGGLSTPRAPSKIVDGDGYDVLDGNTRVVNQSNEDVTENFIRGAMEVLKIARVLNVKEAILESKSPSCGCRRIYNETSGQLIEGDGVLTALLKRNGIEVIPKCEKAL